MSFTGEFRPIKFEIFNSLSEDVILYPRFYINPDEVTESSSSNKPQLKSSLGADEKKFLRIARETKEVLPVYLLRRDCIEFSGKIFSSGKSVLVNDDRLFGVCGSRDVDVLSLVVSTKGEIHLVVHCWWLLKSNFYIDLFHR